MKPSLGRVIIYSKNVERMTEFYQKYFGFHPVRSAGDRIVELVSQDHKGASIMLHAAATSARAGQSQVKLVFDVEDVEAFRIAPAKKGLKFGVVHQVQGYCFSNAKDPDKNSIQISSRGFR